MWLMTTSSILSGSTPIAWRPSRGGSRKSRPRFLAIAASKPVSKDQGTALADNGPDEIVERHRPVMRVATVEILTRAPVMMRIAHRVDLIGIAAHGPLPSRI